MRKEFEGIITALITPFTPSGEVEEDALRDVTDFLIEHGIHGLYPCGTAGEGMIMSLEDRKRVAEIVIDQTSGRIPVMVHVGAARTSETVELAKHAEDAGADAIGCVTPYYYSPDEEALIEHYRLVADAVSIPLFIYNIPRNTNVNITPELMLKLLKLPNIVGLKDSSGNFIQVLEFIRKLPPETKIITGADAYIFPALVMGAKGVITAYSNPFPEIFLELYNAYQIKDWENARKMQLRINMLRSFLSNPPISPLKEALRMRGHYAGTVKRPLRPMTEEEKETLQKKLIETGFMKGQL